MNSYHRRWPQDKKKSILFATFDFDITNLPFHLLQIIKKMYSVQVQVTIMPITRYEDLCNLF